MSIASLKQKITPIWPIAGIFLFVIISVYSVWLLEITTPKLPLVQRIDEEYPTDLSQDQLLVGASHNIFMAKVVQQIGTKDRGIGPETQFQVQVIDNIKGDLQGTVTVDQQGGYRDGVLYVVGDDGGATNETPSKYLLQPGGTYVLATRYNKDENWYTLIAYPTASKLLNNDVNISDAGAKALANNDQRVQQLKAAYPNEILLQADIAHNNTLNSYASVQAALANPPAPKPKPPPSPPADTPANPPVDASTTDSSATPDPATSTPTTDTSSSSTSSQ